jgi:hypothetical protein
MRQNLNALSVELYNAISNWNDCTYNDDDNTVLTEEQVGQYADSLYEHLITDLYEMELLS